MGWWRDALRAISLLPFLLFACTCAPGRATARDGGAPPARLVALLINGGGTPQRNYYSHLAHLRQLTATLRSAGLTSRDITVFSSDGSDPAPDVAVLRASGDDTLLHGTALGALIGEGNELEDGAIEGVHLLPARRAAIETWFALEARALRPGDTIFLYVTDHGERGANPREGAITLWGEKLTVAELEGMLGLVPAGVRVVSLMSQCYSGAFAQDPHAGRCGYFSTFSDRRAYGCYPEAQEIGLAGDGHSARFLTALRAGGDLAAAHSYTALSDSTPDVPLRSSELFARSRLQEEAKRRPQPVDELAEKLLASAVRAPARYQERLQLLDRLGQAYGLPQAPTVRMLNEQQARLTELQKPLERQRNVWSGALQDLAKEIGFAFQEARPLWKAASFDALYQQQVKAGRAPAKLAAPEARRALWRLALQELDEFARRSPALARLEALRKRARLSKELYYRMETRVALVLRMRLLIDAIAGEVLLEQQQQLRPLRDLQACEALRLPLPATPAALPPPAQLPPLEADVAQLPGVQPSWMGLEFSSEKPGRFEVLQVLSGSPADQAGLEIGDAIVSLPGQPLGDRQALRDWTLLSPAGEARTITIERHGSRMELAVRPARYPDQMPQPKPLKGRAPARDTLAYVRGAAPQKAQRTLLYFFATWCGPCKRALPRVLEIEKQGDVQVIAVSSEAKDVIERFLAERKEPFVARVAIDPEGKISRGYQAQALPTFVLVDGAEQITYFQRGYSDAQGLKLP